MLCPQTWWGDFVGQWAAGRHWSVVIVLAGTGKVDRSCAEVQSHAVLDGSALAPWIQTWRLKLFSCELLPVITNVISASLATSVLSAVFNCAIVKPVLKKSTPDNDALHYYRYVSNLPIVSKLVERVAAKQLNAHLDDNALRDPVQSAYHQRWYSFARMSNSGDALCVVCDKKYH